MGEEIFVSLESNELVRYVTRLGTSVLLGGAIGWERERSSRSAGLRTHILVTLGCAAFMILGLKISEVSGGDPMRIVQGIALGIGFLGAGTILKLPDEKRIEGLTTSSGIWTTATVGVAIGAGWLVLACVITALTVAVMSVLYFTEKGSPHRKDV